MVLSDGHAPSRTHDRLAACAAGLDLRAVEAPGEETARAKAKLTNGPGMFLLCSHAHPFRHHPADA